MGATRAQKELYFEKLKQLLHKYRAFPSLCAFLTYTNALSSLHSLYLPCQRG